jgi:hypothetical protein
VAERDRATVDVDLVLVELEHPQRVERHRGERLVDLPEVDVLGAQTDLGERLPGGVGGCASEVGEVVGDRGLGDDRRQHSLAVGLGPRV